MTPPASGVNGLIIATQAELDARLDRLRDEIIESLGARALPRMLDSAGMCEWLGISMPTLRRLESEGCPLVRMGECRRYDLDLVRQWLTSRQATP